MFSPGYDFGYTWFWTRSHVIVCVAFGLLALLTWRLKWPRWTSALASLIALWGLAGALVVHEVMRANKPLVLPTTAFLPGGRGEVLDMGAGSGRSTLMVLQARPYVRVTALDIYRGDQFGIGDNTPQRLLANARMAGVADRVDVKVGDMRQMPFGDRSFDAAVSAYAIDHLGQDGVRQSLAEASRVLRPRGQLLLLVVNVDGWVRLAFPSLHGHGYFSRPQYRDRWRDALAAAGFDVIEDGTPPTTLYLLASRRAD